MAITAHDDKLGAAPASLGQQGLLDVTVAPINVMQNGRNPMVPQMLLGIGAKLRLFSHGRFGIDHADYHSARVLKVRQALGESACGFSAPIPGDEYAVEARFALTTGWDQVKVASRAEQNILNNAVWFLRRAIGP